MLCPAAVRKRGGILFQSGTAHCQLSSSGEQQRGVLRSFQPSHHEDESPTTTGKGPGTRSASTWEAEAGGLLCAGGRLGLE